jgi:hypothetical protein
VVSMGQCSSPGSDLSGPEGRKSRECALSEIDAVGSTAWEDVFNRNVNILIPCSTACQWQFFTGGSDPMAHILIRDLYLFFASQSRNYDRDAMAKMATLRQNRLLLTDCSHRHIFQLTNCQQNAKPAYCRCHTHPQEPHHSTLPACREDHAEGSSRCIPVYFGSCDAGPLGLARLEESAHRQ